MNTPSHKLPPFLRVTSPESFHVTAEDAALFGRELRSFIPARVFDAHAHLYDLVQVHPELPADESRTRVGYEVYQRQQRAWMGDRVPQGGLFFASPHPTVDMAAANEFVRRELRDRPGSCGLMLIRPSDDPAAVESQVCEAGWSGFKVYHVFSGRPDSQNAFIGEYLPDWAWEIAQRHGLVIMLHLVRQRSLADVENQQYIREYCRRYPGARLILAHAARGFCAAHTVEGVRALRGLGNVYFDTSAICEAAAFEAILDTFGPTHLLYGSDFPVSEAHGRAISLGDSFHWIYEWDQAEWPLGKPVLVGLESLMALRRACQSRHLNGADVELIFHGNASRLLSLEPVSKDSVQALYEAAKTLIPGGTQLLSKRPEMFAPGVWPAYEREARGIEIITQDGRRLLDFTTTGIGSCLLGFAHPTVSAAVLRRVQLGSMSTLNPPDEVELARRLLELHPWAEQARFGRAGGEALSAAIRIARAATGRDVIAFCGYHGWHDWYLAANLSQDDSLDGHLLPGLESRGVPRALQGTALPFSYNDLGGLHRIVRENGQRLAAVVMEPTRSVHPQPGFLEGVRALCDESGARLIFDEVTTGFRLHRAGVHLHYGVEPDIAVFAKALGNGHPIAAVIGKRDTMEAAQTSFISSTYWTEGVGPAAALATLEVLSGQNVPAHVAAIGTLFRDALTALAQRHEVPLRVGGHPALTTLGFNHPESAALLTLYTIRMLERGFLTGGAFYPSLAHTSDAVQEYLDAAGVVLAELGEMVARNEIQERLTTPVKHGGFARLN